MVLVSEYRDHPTTFWIPERYWRLLHIIPDDADALAFERDSGKPLVVVDHGTMDITYTCPIKGTMYSQLYADYYCSSTRQGHENLTRLGKVSYYTGSAFADFTYPRVRRPHLLVYAPPHTIRLGDDSYCCVESLLGRDGLAELCDAYGCDDYVTSVLAEDDRIGQFANPLVSDRRGDLEGHHMKCEYLYEHAKVIYEPFNGTFGTTGAALGIEVVGFEPRNETLNDGRCRERIIAAFEDVIRREQL